MSQAVAARVRGPVFRVALISTAVVAAAYVLIAVVVLIVVTINLTGQIDSRLTGVVSRLSHGPSFGGDNLFIEPPDEAPRFAPPLLLWVVGGDGSVTSPNTNVQLPSQFRDVAAPQTVSIQGTDVRIDGTAISGGRLVIGQTLDSVGRTRDTIIATELAIAPALLAIVFVGSLAIGRRVATPIERARQQQMDFTADASHELRTPLSVIEAQTNLALAKDHPKTWYRAAFERIGGESQRMRHLVEDLLWLARLDAAASPAAEPVDVGVLAQQSVERFAAVAQERQVSLTAAGAAGCVVMVAPEWTDRLIGVLVDNACRYTPAGGSVDVSVSADGNRVRLAVDDSGPGISESERSRIFDRFARATDAHDGSGLGLAIADAVVRHSGGRWHVGVSPAGGASMAVTWPRYSLGNSAGQSST